MIGRTAVLVAALAMAACNPTKTPDADRVQQPVASTPDAPAKAAVEDPAPAPVPTPSAKASSVIRRGSIVAADVSDGLKAFAAEWTSGGTLWIGKLAGNGARDVVIFVPDANFRPDADVRVVFHFHGTFSERIAKQTPALPKKEWVGWDRLVQTMEAIAQLQAEGEDNVALVYPLSAGKRPEPGHTGWFNKDYDRVWMLGAAHGDDFDALYEQSLAVLSDELGVSADRIRPDAIAEGHSAGGYALRNIAVDGTARVGRYIFLDASFQGWADGCVAAVKDQRRQAQVTIVLTDKGIADPHIGRSPWCATMPALAEAWPAAKSWCAATKLKASKAKPPGRRDSCEDLQWAAEEWPNYRQWCADVANDMRDVAGVTLVRTKVAHGDQPRQFSGGLNLPPEKN